MPERGRHPSTVQLVRWFHHEHLPPDLQAIARPCSDLARTMLELIPEDDPELSSGLRKLLEAKDCFVRASIVSRRRPGGGNGD